MITHQSSFHSSSTKKSKRASAHVSSGVNVNPFNPQLSSALIQTTFGQLSSKQLVDTHSLFCAKHNQKPIEKVCLHPQCEQDILLCTECFFDYQSHISNHREYIFGYVDFIQLCKENSLNHHDALPQDKSFNLIISELDSNMVKYKTHIRREEEKIDADFDSLIENVVNDLNDLRNKLKEKLKTHQDTYQGLCNQLREQTSSLNKEASSNHRLNNEYDTFLNNLISQKNNTINFKRLITNLKPIILKQLQQEPPKNILGLSNFQSNKSETSIANNLVGDKSHQSNTLTSSSLFNTQYSSSQSSSLSDKGVNKFQKNLKDIFNEFQSMTTYKPLYRNKGEANNIYRAYLAEHRRQYFSFLEGLSEFVALQTNPAAQANGQFNGVSNVSNVPTSVMGINNTLTNTNTLTASSFCMQSPPSKKNCKACFGSSNKKQNAVLLNSFTNFNNLYTNQTVVPTDANNQVNNEDAVYYQNSGFSSQNVKLADKQKIATIDHLQTVNTKHSKGIFAIKVIDAETIVTASSDRSVRIYKNFVEVKEIPFQYDATCLSTLRSNELLLVGLYQCFAVVNLSDYSIVKIVNCEHESSINQLVGLNDSQTVLTVSTDPKIISFNLFNSEITHPKKYFEHRDSVYCLELFPNQKFVATAGKDRSIKVWKLNFYNNFRQNALEKLSLELSLDNAHTTDVTALKACINYDTILISGAANGDIKIWDTVLGKPLKLFRNNSGWIFNIITLERPHLANIINENRKPIIDSWKENNENMCSPKRNFGSSSKQQNNLLENFQSPIRANKLTKAQVEQINNISFVTSSFDGMMKVWEASKDAPVLSQKNKNIYECYPFGGVGAYKTENKIHLVTSGNRGDNTLNIWALK
ncbi:hypothetical protein ABPG74_021001 [Tetrahymena malaccensis]